MAMYSVHQTGARPTRIVAFDYLRACAVVLVLFHHAISAYVTFAVVNLADPIATFSPVVDEQRWWNFDVIVELNDSFLMALLFLVSGLFVWQSLERRGARGFFVRRLVRLGAPLLVCVPTLIPLAFYPAQLQVASMTGGDSSFGLFYSGLVRSGFGTAGHLWFLWVLLAFGGLVSLVRRFLACGSRVSRVGSAVPLERPLALFGILFGISVAAYLPMALAFGPYSCVVFGPFEVQTSRVLLYLAFFLVGTAIGASGFDRAGLRADGVLAWRWWIWLGLGGVAFLAFQGALEVPALNSILLMACCVCCVLAAMGIALRFATRRVRALDSLSENSYGIYIVHLLFVTWLQHSLLEIPLHAAAKGGIVFVGALLLSWGTVAVIRKIPAVARVI